MHKRIILALAACAFLAATGCDTVKPYLKSTKKMYKEYINVDPTVDLSDIGISDPTVIKLAELFTPVDAQLEYLLRAMSAQDAPPEADWVQNVLASFPWVSGVALLDTSGNVINKQPSFSLKKVNFTPLLEFDALYQKRKMASYVDASELGSEILIAKPLYVENDMKGLLVVHFDVAALAKQSPEPGKLLIVSPGGVLWPGDDSGAAQSLAQSKWKDILKSNVSGDENIGGHRYLWQSRSIAQSRIVYATEVVKALPKPAKVAPQPQPAQEPVQEPVKTPAQAPAQ